MPMYLRERRRHRGPRWQYIFAVWLRGDLWPDIPPLIRAGLEGYKGLVIDGLLVLTLVITIASYGNGLFTRLFSTLPRAATTPASTQ